MTKEQFLKILKDNDVRYDRDIEMESTEGFVSDECAEYAQKLYDDLYTLTGFGIRYGFSKCEEDIRALTKLVASLIAGTSRKAVNLAKTEAKRQQILKGANYLKKEIDMDMLNQLTDNLNDCIAAAEAISIIRKDNEPLCQKLSESKETLEKIKETLSNVADATSTAAAEYQVKIFEALMDWREAVSRYNCYTDTVEGLKGALKEAEEWCKLTSTVRHTAKRGKDYYEYGENFDDIGYIISAARYAERTEGMRGHLNDFRAQTDLLYSVSSLQEELEKAQSEFIAKREQINNRLAEIKEETDATLFKYQNGEIDAVIADMKVADLDSEAAELDEELQNAQEDFGYEQQDLKIQLRDAQDGSRIRDKIAKNFEGFVNRLEAYRNTDPAMFVMLCSRIDFNGVYDTLTGRLTDKDIDEVYVKVETVIRETEEDLKRQRKNLVGFNAINDRMRENRRAEERVLREQEEERRRKLKEQQTRIPAGGARNRGDAEADAKRRLEERLARRSTATPSDNDGERNVTGSLNIRNDDK